MVASILQMRTLRHIEINVHRAIHITEPGFASLTAVCRLTLYCLWLLSAATDRCWSEDWVQKLSLLYLVLYTACLPPPLTYEFLKIRDGVALTSVPNAQHRSWHRE